MGWFSMGFPVHGIVLPCTEMGMCLAGPVPGIFRLDMDFAMHGL